MANVQHGQGVAGSGVEDQGHGAEHTGFLHKLKDKLHIGHKHKEEKVVDSGAAAPSQGGTTSGAPVVSKDDQVTAAPVSEPVESGVVAPPPAIPAASAAAVPDPSVYQSEHVHRGDVRPTSSDYAGHESEHHGGVRTFLATLPDQDVPAEDAPEHRELHHTPKDDTSSEQAHHDVVPEGGVPTFLSSLPDRDIPAEDAPEHRELHHTPKGDTSSEQAHHDVVPEGGVPTFLSSLPDRDIPAEDSPRHPQLHHIGGSSHVDARDERQGEHHYGVVPDGGVPTFLASLPNQDIPPEDSPRHYELRHVEPPARPEFRDDDQQGGVGDCDRAPPFDSEQAQQGEHHGGVPTFLTSLPDRDIPVVDSPRHSELRHVEPGRGDAPRFDSEQVFE